MDIRDVRNRLVFAAASTTIGEQLVMHVNSAQCLCTARGRQLQEGPWQQKTPGLWTMQSIRWI